MKHHLCETSAISLRDGRSVQIRPLTSIDRRALLAFGHALPSDDELSIADDWHNPEVVDWLIAATGLEHWRQFIATSGDMIVGYGAALRLSSWSGPIAEIYTIISRGWRHAGLEPVLAIWLLDAGRNLKVDKAIVELSSTQQPERLKFEQLGFRAEGTINAHLYTPNCPTRRKPELRQPNE